MSNHTGSIALVTGAAAGIGRATALAFARAGCDVAIADINKDSLQSVGKEIENMGQRCLVQVADTGKEEDIVTLHQKVYDYFGCLDHACNNAGIEGVQAPLAESSLENFDRVINVNLRGVFLCMKAQLGIMIRQQSGSIVNMASVAGLVGFAGLPAYCASKGGVVQLTRTAALEYAEQGIRINAVCPGAIKTDMIDRITGKDPQVEASFNALHPMNRMGTVEEIANAVVWLCLPQSSFITGHALPVDGGMVAR